MLMLILPGPRRAALASSAPAPTLTRSPGVALNRTSWLSGPPIPPTVNSPPCWNPRIPPHAPGFTRLITSLSLSPMQFLICVDERSESLAPMLASGFFCINLLASGQEEISRRFAGKSADKFAGVPHRIHASSVPVLEGTVAFAVCRIASALPGGDHRIIVGEVLHADASGGDPLLHFRGGYRALQ